MNGRVAVLLAAAIGGAWYLLRPGQVQTVAMNSEPEAGFNWLDWGESMTGSVDTPADKMPALQYFGASEFREWWLYMDIDLLQKLDAFRREWGRPITISTHPDALGRHLGDARSYHNVDRYGAVRAVDLFPQGLTPENAAYAVQLAERVGLGGIGLYTDTRPSMMMHVDNRSDPGRWARVAGDYLGIDQAYA